MDIYKTLNFSLEELYTGVNEYKLSYKRQIKCEYCRYEELKNCQVCHSEGIIIDPSGQEKYLLCHSCLGCGLDYSKQDCLTCFNTGIIKNVDAHININISRGLESGSIITIKQAGHQQPKLPTGDLIITILAKLHPDFEILPSLTAASLPLLTTASTFAPLPSRDLIYTHYFTSQEFLKQFANCNTSCGSGDNKHNWSVQITTIDGHDLNITHVDLLECKNVKINPQELKQLVTPATPATTTIKLNALYEIGDYGLYYPNLSTRGKLYFRILLHDDLS